ncbi:putative meiosis protein [Triangularia verruculosa]|uniref:Meiosis protein n=1 Tax=Triangularia verruculosa TaxID=2587418 RepID=A0AAN7ATZ1_9PEZI|nr:putative meiosis protein [Triangularia verruculosa]
MSQAREPFNPSSPRSSSGAADSYKHDGTPDTRLTAFSPDDVSARSSKMYVGLNSNMSSTNHALFHQTSTEHFGNVAPAVEKDPFISSNATPSKSTLDQKLSPTASAFRPLSGPLVAHGSLNGQQSSSNGPHQKFRSISNIVGPLSGHFSSDLDATHYVIIFCAAKSVTVPEVEAFLEKLSQFGSSCQGKRVIFEHNGKVYLFLSNIRDALAIHDNVQVGSQDWRAQYIAAVEFYQARNPGEHHQQVSDGLLRVIAFPQEHAGFDFLHTNTVVRTLVESHGEVLAFHQVSGMKDIPFQAMVEFCDCDAAIAAADALNGRSCNGVYLNLMLVSAQSDATSGGFQPLQGPRAPRSPVQDMANMFQNMGISKPAHQQQMIPSGRLAHSPAGGMQMAPQQMAPHQMPSQQMSMYPSVVYHGLQHNMTPRYVLDHTPTRSQGISPMSPMTPMTGGMPVMAPLYTPPATPMAYHHGDYASPRAIQPYNRMDGRRQNAMRVNRSPYYNAAGHHNHVDVNKIRDGIDVRTTIMLRNIPNKVDQAMLKKIVDESSWGKYDFMYLRIDFANDCNVGYAFINFVDPLDIIDFVNARGNQRWNCFKSDKVAEISYATIQGKDCLVQKFRNSSVMLEAPHYRPKLYFTLNGPRPELAGNEEPFPGPDNQSKMKRSCENAEHVGLFTPNAGQHFRDEQRRRRSQYDRGTRLAALEEYDYDSHIQQPNLYLG